MVDELSLVWKEVESAMRYKNGHSESDQIDYYRLRVPGGWLLRAVGYSPALSITYVPDPEHTWLAEEPMPAS